jgi:uncharacterized damage-inducible protein DinB
MYSIEHLRDLFTYDDWANRRLIVALKQTSSDKSRRVLAHVLITKREYFERLYGKDSTGFDFWPDLSVEECSRLNKELAETYERLLSNFEDEGLGLTARYKTSEGVSYENTFRELLTHVLLHSSIHRGNIILKLREECFAPPKIDYVIYLREAR